MSAHRGRDPRGRRCKVCPDGIGEAADIAAADTWPGGSPDPGTEDADDGTNAVVIRTQAGLDLMSAAEAAGYVTIESEVDPRYMNEVQPQRSHRGRASPTGAANPCTRRFAHRVRERAEDHA